MTVWLVERHGVEDYYVVEVFSTKELAYKWVENQKDPYMYSVVDWEVKVS